VNVHGSLLPRYRGRTPHVWAIINGEKQTGVTLHILDENCDTGDIISQVSVEITWEDTGASLLRKFEELYIPIIRSVISDAESGKITSKKQDNSKASFFRKRTPEDGQINWEWQRERIYNWVRAQAFPYPGAFTYFNNSKIIIDKIAFSDLGFSCDMPNGTIQRDANNSIYVKTPNGMVELVKVRNIEDLNNLNTGDKFINL
jgi:methionyl-tRNA formyltransferase